MIATLKYDIHEYYAYHQKTDLGVTFLKQGLPALKELLNMIVGLKLELRV